MKACVVSKSPASGIDTGAPVPAVAGLDTYLALLDLAYGASRENVARVRDVAERQGRVIDKDGGDASMEKKKQEGYF